MAHFVGDFNRDEAFSDVIGPEEVEHLQHDDHERHQIIGIKHDFALKSLPQIGKPLPDHF
jgi:hypothetical protein